MGLIKAALGAAGGVMADQWLEYFYCDSLPGSQLVNVDGLAYNVGNRHTGIQAGIRILEYNLHLSAVGKHVDLRLMAELNLALLV